LKLDPLPEVTPYRPFTYAAQGLKDPFAVSDFARQETALVEQPEIISSGIKPDQNRTPEELEKYVLGSLKMVGTLLKDENMWALVKAPDGIVHRVRKGNYLGTDYGRIIDISDQQLELLEIVADGPSQWKERNAFLSLSESEKVGGKR
jgi:type IV pilus assembly protein PilP